MEIQKYLFSQIDNGYKIFSSKLMPSVNPNTVLGIRVPIIRKYAKEIYATKQAEEFIKVLPHQYYEENNLHAFLLERINNYEECIKKLNDFLPYINNWATCDMLSPKVFKKNKDLLLTQIKSWLKSEDVYTVRFAIKCLMQHFLGEDFKPEYLCLVANIKSDEYYINMMIAWFFQEALTKQYTSAIVYFENKLLSRFVHNKAISKAIDSYRIGADTKQYLKALRL